MDRADTKRTKKKKTKTEECTQPLKKRNINKAAPVSSDKT